MSRRPIAERVAHLRLVTCNGCGLKITVQQWAAMTAMATGLPHARGQAEARACPVCLCWVVLALPESAPRVAHVTAG